MPYKQHSKNVSSSSLRKIPPGNRRSNAPDGDKGPLTRAEFRVHDKNAPFLPSTHGAYNPELTTAYPMRYDYRGEPMVHKPVKRKPLPAIDSRRGGLVGPELDYSVRVRNMPIIFQKAFERNSYARWKGIDFRKVYLTLFGYRPAMPAEYRPRSGCFPTLLWDDHQVETWTKLANFLRISYSGKHEYSFPSGYLGSEKYGTYYDTGKHPWRWPWEKNPACEGPKFTRRNRRVRKRSEFARIRRSLLRGKKEMVVKPLDFATVLVQKRVYPCRTINAVWNAAGRPCPISVFKGYFPLKLVVNCGKHSPAPAPQIVVDSLKRIAKSVSKLIPDRGWMMASKSEYKVDLTPPPTRKAVKLSRERCGRLAVTFASDGNIYSTRAKLDNAPIFGAIKFGSKELPPKGEYMKIARKLRDYIDELSDESDVPATLGSWENRESILGDW